MRLIRRGRYSHHEARVLAVRTLHDWNLPILTANGKPKLISPKLNEGEAIFLWQLVRTAQLAEADWKMKAASIQAQMEELLKAEQLIPAE